MLSGMPNKLDLRFAIVGCGLIGKKRAAALGNSRLLYACDLDLARATTLAAGKPDCRAINDHRTILADKNISAVIVSTLNGALAPVALDCVRAGKHVLVEKPGGLNAAELREVQAAAKKTG